MRKTSVTPILNRLVEPLSDCLTKESAQRLLALKADPVLQARVDELADKCSNGTLTNEERDEYARYVSFGTFIAILKSKARLMLKSPRSA